MNISFTSLLLFLSEAYPSLSAAKISILFWWTYNGTIAAINATISLPWFKPCFTVFTFIKKLAGIGWHCFFATVSTNRASNNRLKYDSAVHLFYFFLQHCLVESFEQSFLHCSCSYSLYISINLSVLSSPM